MRELLIILAKGIAGGLFVALFALIGESVKPKSFSGLFSAAPSIALAALAITTLADGSSASREQALAMIFGANGMVVYCILAPLALERYGAITGSVAPFAGWFAIAAASYLLVLR